MPMIPPLVRDPPPDERQSSTGRPVSARMVRPQRRYASNFNVSFEYEPPPPIPKPGVAAPASTFDKWRAAAELDPPGGGAGGPPNPAARGDVPTPGAAAAPRRTLHDVLLGTTAVVLLCVVGGIGYIVWSGALPGMAASPGVAAPKGSSLAAVVQPFMDLAAKAVPDRTAARPPAQDGAPGTPPPLPSTAPNLLVLATPSADKPALTGPPPSPAPGFSAMAREAAPAPERVAAGPAPLAKPSDPEAAASTPAVPGAAAEAMSVPAPERATAAVVPPAKVPEPDTAPPVPAVPAKPAPAAEQAATKAAPPAKPSEPDTALAVPAVAAMTVRLPPAPEWMAPAPAALASLPGAAALPSEPPALPVVPASPVPSAGPAAVPDEAAKAVLPGVDAQQVVSTMTLVQQMSLLVHDMHDEGLRYRMEVTALTGAVQAKALGLEERLKLAEARSAGGPDAGGPQAGLPGSDAPPMLRGYRVQAGSPGAAVLTDVGAGPERAARLLVMVGDQLPGAGRVTAIVQRGRAWIVRTERGVIQ